MKYGRSFLEIFHGKEKIMSPNNLSIIFLLISCITQVYSKNHQPTETDYQQALIYFKQHEVNPVLKKLLDHIALKKIIHRGGLIKALDEYIVKDDITRLEGADIIKQAIRDEKLNLLAVPKKTLYHDPESPFDLFYDEQAHDEKGLYRYSKGRYYVVAKKIVPAQTYVLSLDHIKQLITLIKKTKFVDIQPGNFMLDKKGILYIIDTQLRSFSSDASLSNFTNLMRRYFSKGKWKEYLTPQAYEYVLQLLKPSLSYQN